MYQILELMVGARNLVRDFAQVQPGEEVLIVTDTTGKADPVVLQAVALAIKEVGGKVSIIYVEDFEPRVEEPPKMVQQAIYGCSKVFWACSKEVFLHSKSGMTAMYDYGVSILPIVANTKEIMNSEWARFPIEVFWAIAKKVFEQVRKGTRIRVVGDNGTDLSAGVNSYNLVGLPVLIDPHPPIKGTCGHGMFPPGCCGFHPEGDVNGTIVYDLLVGFDGILKEPLKLHVKDHWVADVEGGNEAKWLKDKMKEKINGNYLAEIMWGLNPKASLQRGIEEIKYREGELTRRAGTIHFGLGNSMVLGGPVYSNWHWDGVIISPFTVYIDNNPIIKDGRLLALDDQEIIDLASKYGNPKELLTEAQ